MSSHGASSKRSLGVFLIYFLAILALSVTGIAYLTENSLRKEFLLQAQLVAKTINENWIDSCNGTASNLTSPDYLSLKTQLAKICSDNRNYKFAYLCSKNLDGEVIFLIDSEPPDSPDYSPPGQIYDEASESFHRVFDTEISDIEGPFEDRWGVFITALVPVKKATSGKSTVVLGIDIDAATWHWQVAAKSALPISIVFIVIVSMSVIVAIKRQFKLGEQSIQRQLIPIITLILLIFIIGFGLLLFRSQNFSIDQRSLSEFNDTILRYDKTLQKKSEDLSRLVPELVSNRIVQQLFVPGEPIDNPHQLQAEIDLLMTDIGSGVTHGFFVGSDGECLYEYPPDEHLCDRIRQNDFSSTVRNQPFPTGLDTELTGIPAIWIIQPVTVSDLPVGFMAIGSTITTTLETFRLSQNLEFALYLDDDPKTGYRTIFSSPGSIPASLLDTLILDPREPTGEQPQWKDVRVSNRNLRVFSSSLNDRSGREIGLILVAVDISSEKALLGHIMKISSIAVFAWVVLLLAVIYVVVYKADREIRHRKTEVQHLVEYLGATLRSIHDGVISTDAKGLITSLNYVAETLTGWSESSASGKPVSEVFAVQQSSSGSVVDPVTQAIAENKVTGFSDNSILISRNGKHYRISASCAPIQGENGQTMGAVLVFRDVSEDYRTLETLTVSEEKNRLLSELTFEGILIHEKGIIRDVNHSLELLFGYSQESLVTKNFIDLIVHPDDRELVRQNIEKEYSKPYEIRAIRKNGEMIDVEIEARQFVMGDQTFRVAAIRNLAEKKQSAALLKRSENRFDLLAEQSRTITWEVDSTGEFLFVSHVVEQVLELHPEEVIGRMKIFDQHPEEGRDVFRNKILKIFSEKKPFKGYVHPVQTNTGSNLWFLTNGIPLLDSDGSLRGYQGSSTDITTQKLAKIALRESEKKVKAKLNAIFAPDGEIIRLRLDEILDVKAIQMIMNHFHSITHVGMAIIDLEGRILVATGWQTICTKFHRIHPKTRQYCIESDLELGKTIAPDTFKVYKCKNGLTETLTPIYIGEHHFGSLILGQFFFDDEKPDRAFFAAQAAKYGFDEEEYLTALEECPRWSRSFVESIMSFYSTFVSLVSKLSYSGIKLARSLEQQKHVEHALRYSELRLRGITESTQDAIIMIDSLGLISFWNPSAEKILGYTAAEALGMNFHQAMVPARFHEAHAIAFPHFIQTGEGGAVGKTLELVAIHKSGLEIDVALSLSAFQMDGEWHAAGILRDITYSKRIQESLRLANSRLEEAKNEAQEFALEAQKASISKSEFLANMSHEIRTPMNGVIGMTGLLLDTDLNELQKRYAEIIKSSGESLLSLINDILDFSKIEANKLDLEILDFNIQDVLDDFLMIMAIRAQEKGLEFLCEIKPDVPHNLRGDPSRIRQILNNLAGNAFKFTQEGEVAILVELVSETEADCMLKFSVKDTGIGIPEDKIDMLFTQFTQVDSSTTRTYGGTGLGLAITKQLAELMGGKTGVRSELGKGSVFWFTVKLAKQESQTRDPRDFNPEINLTGIHSLVVDDNETNRTLLMMRLRSWGMRPEECSDARSAFKAMEKAWESKDLFRIVLTDMQMPDMDGEALGKQIKADVRFHDVKLVLLTSMGFKGDASKYENAGFDGYIIKPIRQRELYNIITYLMTSTSTIIRPKPPADHRDTAANKKRKFSRKTLILLAEDNMTNQQVALGILKKFGLKANPVANGSEAISALKLIPYDLVLMDIQMPVLDGLEATRLIRKPKSGVLNPDVPIIAMTAHAMQGDREKCLSAGMNDYLSKPINPANLSDVLERWLPVSEEPTSIKPTPPQIQIADTASTDTTSIDTASTDTASTDTASIETTSIETTSIDTASIDTVLKADPDIAVFDMGQIRERLMDDNELIKSILECFLTDMPAQLETLGKSLQTGNLAEATLTAHSIKGASSNISGESVREVAFRMEMAGKEGNLPGMNNLMNELEHQYGILRHTLLRVIEKLR